MGELMPSVDSREIFRTQSLELVAARFRVLSEPMRLRILHELKVEELNVGELVSKLKCSQPSVSKHLKVLLESGIVSRRPVGTSAYYRIAEPVIFQLCDLMCSSLEIQLREKARTAQTLLDNGVLALG